MNTSVLEKTCSNETRPYSRKELETVHKNFIHNSRIGKVFIYHSRCKHGYYCKTGGKKEKEYKESNGQNIGNCSVCWKLNRTPKRLKNTARNLASYYLDIPHESYNSPPSYYHLEIEIDFYTWLYKEFNLDKKKDVLPSI